MWEIVQFGFNHYISICSPLRIKRYHNLSQLYFIRNKVSILNYIILLLENIPYNYVLRHIWDDYCKSSMLKTLFENNSVS